MGWRVVVVIAVAVVSAVGATVADVGVDSHHSTTQDASAVPAPASPRTGAWSTTTATISVSVPASAVHLTDPAAIIHTLNAAARQLIGHSESPQDDTNFVAFYHDLERAAQTAAMGDAMKPDLPTEAASYLREHYPT